MDSTFVIGVNFKNANVEIRSAFSMGAEKQKQCNILAKQNQYRDFIVLSTCNRTEIYGRGSLQKAEKMITSICNQPAGIFNRHKFVKKGKDAVQHIFQVASGLDSQILGDYEILGQFKAACKTSKEHGLLGPVFERMANVCIQASKEIKTQTRLSRGTVSASYAAIEVIRDTFGDRPARTLLVGTGKLGQNIAKNLRHYLPKIRLTLSNRTFSTAETLAYSEGFDLIPFERFPEYIKSFQIVIFCASCEEKQILPEAIQGGDIQLVLDLSVPGSVHPDCFSLPGVEIMDIDKISGILNKTFEERSLYIPAAQEIIEKHIAEFLHWRAFYEKRDRIVSLKKMLIQASEECTFLSSLDEENRKNMVNKALQGFVLNLKENQELHPEEIIARFKQYCHQSSPVLASELTARLNQQDE